MSDEITTAVSFPCPECGKKCESPRGLGVHRRFAHGVKGTSPSTLAKHGSRAKARRISIPTSRQIPIDDRWLADAAVQYLQHKGVPTQAILIALTHLNHQLAGSNNEKDDSK